MVVYFSFFNFDTTINIFHFIYMTNTMSSFQKSIINPLFSYNSSIIFLIWPPLKSITTWINFKSTMLMLHMALHFKIVYNLKK
jgi:hypothetical protein